MSMIKNVTLSEDKICPRLIITPINFTNSLSNPMTYFYIHRILKDDEYKLSAILKNKNSKNQPILCNELNKILETLHTVSFMIAVRVAYNEDEIKILKKNILIQKALNILKGDTFIFPFNFYSIKTQNNIKVSFEENLLSIPDTEFSFTSLNNIDKKEIVKYSFNILTIIIHGIYLAARENVTNFDLFNDNITIKIIPINYNYSTNVIFTDINNIPYRCSLRYIPIFKTLISCNIVRNEKDLLTGFKKNIQDAFMFCGFNSLSLMNEKGEHTTLDDVFSSMKNINKLKDFGSLLTKFSNLKIKN
jgi:hypothetical protein